MINLVQVAQGFLNATKAEFGVADPKVEAEAERRYEICLKCPLVSDGQLNCDADKCIGDKCGCGCYLPWKTRSGSSCPLKKW